MKNIIIIIILILVIVIIGYLLFVQKSNKNLHFQILNMIKITSSVFSNGERIPQKYTCSGEDVNPPLSISNIPENAQSLVLIVDDPDAPMGTWNHWLVWNISPDRGEVVENSVPEGATLGKNDFGVVQYRGPCPPSGTHRYFFRVFALSKMLDLKEGASRQELEKAMKDYILDKGELMGIFSR